MNNMFLLYIDPGTGSMLFSLFIGLAAALTFGLRALFMKIKFFLSGGKASKNESDKIPFVIFSDHKRYWNVFKPICDEFEKRGVDLVYLTASPDDPALTAGYQHIKGEYLGENNKPYARLNMLNADIVISTTPGLGVLQWKRSKGVKLYVHVPHTVDDLSGYRMFGLDYYDVVLTTGQNQIDLIRKIEELRPAIAKKELVTVGSPNLDAMKARLSEESSKASSKLPDREPSNVSAQGTGEYADASNAADGSGKKNKGKKTVLVAPSWGVSGILSRYGEKLLDSLSKTDFNVIVRPHPQTVVSEQNILKPLEEKYQNIEWNYDNDNFSVLDKADLLITDFSGIIFDYSLVFDKPLIYADTNFDTLPYDADWISEPMWSFRVLPRLGLQLKEEDFDKIGSIINQAIESKNLQEGRNAVRAECWEHQGECAKRITDYLLEKQKTL